MDVLSAGYLRETGQTVSCTEFHAQRETASCTVCGMTMIVEKTERRHISTMALGKVTVMEYFMVCPNKCVMPNGMLCRERSSELSKLVAHGANYGYDIEVFIGLQRFIYHRQRLEIKELIKQSACVDISESEISVLEARFLNHFEIMHKLNAGDLKDAMKKDGGYPMHIDATCECGRGTTLTFYAGWRGWTLGAWKIPSEREDAISPCIKEVESMFGVPISYMSDLGKAMMQATTLAAGSHDTAPAVFVCHTHFLNALGKSILEKEHDKLAASLRGLAVKKRLGDIAKQIGHKISNASCIRMDIVAWAKEGDVPPLPEGMLGCGIVRTVCQWVLDYMADCGNFRFPFALPQLSLFRRCELASKAITNLMKHAKFDYSVTRYFERVQKTLIAVLSDKNVCKVVKTLQEKSCIFEELRHALRLDLDIPSDIHHFVNSDTMDGVVAVKKIEECVNSYCSGIRQAVSKKRGTKAELAAMRTIIAYIDKYGDYLWGHAIALGDGRFRLVDRTNNVLEAFFGEYKHGERRRSGRKCLTYDLEAASPTALLVANLTRTDYVNIVCGGSLSNLSTVFADIDRRSWLAKCNLTDNISAVTGRIPFDDFVSTALPFADRQFVRSDIINGLIMNAAATNAEKSLPVLRSNIGIPIENADASDFLTTPEITVHLLNNNTACEPLAIQHSF